MEEESEHRGRPPWLKRLFRGLFVEKESIDSPRKTEFSEALKDSKQNKDRYETPGTSHLDEDTVGNPDEPDVIPVADDLTKDCDVIYLDEDLDVRSPTNIALSRMLSCKVFHEWKPYRTRELHDALSLSEVDAGYWMEREAHKFRERRTSSFVLTILWFLLLLIYLGPRHVIPRNPGSCAQNFTDHILKDSTNVNQNVMTLRTASFKNKDTCGRQRTLNTIMATLCLSASKVNVNQAESKQLRAAPRTVLLSHTVLLAMFITAAMLPYIALLVGNLTSVQRTYTGLWRPNKLCDY